MKDLRSSISDSFIRTIPSVSEFHRIDTNTLRSWTLPPVENFTPPWNRLLLYYMPVSAFCQGVIWNLLRRPYFWWRGSSEDLPPYRQVTQNVLLRFLSRLPFRYCSDIIPLHLCLLLGRQWIQIFVYNRFKYAVTVEIKRFLPIEKKREMYYNNKD